MKVGEQCPRCGSRISMKTRAADQYFDSRRQDRLPTVNMNPWYFRCPNGHEFRAEEEE